MLKKFLSLYSDKKLLFIIILGFSSGVPFLLTLATLQVWLAESGVSKTLIGLLVITTIPYSLKFLLAPILDKHPAPFFGHRFGLRRGWILLAQIGLFISLLALGFSDPAKNLTIVAICSFCVAFFSAVQDISYEAFRMEFLDAVKIGAGAAASSFGYRLGIWIAGAGALFIASWFSWKIVYGSMAFIIMACSYITITIPKDDTISHKNMNLKSAFSIDILKKVRWPLMLGFIFMYKIGDTVLNTMTMPFLLEIGFSKIEIATIAKAFGLLSMIVGSLIGGLVLTQHPVERVVLLVFIMQILSSIIFMGQAIIGNDIIFLFFNMAFENFACGFGYAAFIVFLSNNCHQNHMGTHFAIFASFASLCRISISSVIGFVADRMSWVSFYGCTSLCLFICLCFIVLKFHTSNRKAQKA